MELFDKHRHIAEFESIVPSLLHNELTDLNVTQHPHLEELWASLNPIMSLDITQNPNLLILQVDNTLLTTLNINQNLNLEGLSFSTTQI